jgi:hypothetical protein
MARPRKPRRQTIGGLTEPDWTLVLMEQDERTLASEHWVRVATEMDSLQILSLSNEHAIRRLVIAYIVYDRCTRLVGIHGLVTEPSEANPKAIARLSVHYQAMREAEKTAERLEGQLGIAPGRRGTVGKVSKKQERRTGADAFLGPKG